MSKIHFKGLYKEPMPGLKPTLHIPKGEGYEAKFGKVGSKGVALIEFEVEAESKEGCTLSIQTIETNPDKKPSNLRDAFSKFVDNYENEDSETEKVEKE